MNLKFKFLILAVIHLFYLLFLNYKIWKILFIFLKLISVVRQVYSGALQLNNQNFDATLSGHELVFVNFYANWCRFSQMLEPIYDDFADKAARELPVISTINKLIIFLKLKENWIFLGW